MEANFEKGAAGLQEKSSGKMRASDRSLCDSRKKVGECAGCRGPEGRSFLIRDEEATYLQDSNTP